MTDSKPSVSRRRGRPSVSKAKIVDTRKHITGCAMRLFREDGYEAVSMRRLAKEADCTVMTLYRYFDRKIDILRELWGEVFTELFDQLEQIAAEEKNATQRLNAVALGYVNYWLEQREHYYLVFMSSGVSQPDVSVFVESEDIVGRFALIFSSLAEALGETTEDVDLNIKAQLLICILNGISHNLITISAFPWAEPEALVDAAVVGVLGT